MWPHPAVIAVQLLLPLLLLLHVFLRCRRCGGSNSPNCFIASRFFLSHSITDCMTPAESVHASTTPWSIACCPSCLHASKISLFVASIGMSSIFWNNTAALAEILLSTSLTLFSGPFVKAASVRTLQWVGRALLCSSSKMRPPSSGVRVVPS
ncbi:Zinc knuckle [Carpediemonas membranifera]|uniref:Zinc knuckle n=1 Tax=Carpediemonas membranifera TaxID=201153 RepID=A0A8J6ATU6_9EUKA|nr:Zinc knuckle [Carpediemonas membranifera]|eukprot:KAG9392270.1 Zinc knuckle [Carpediemonas membranifera]